MNADKLSQAMTWIQSKKNLYIGGQWRPSSGKTFRSINPANEKTLCEFSMANSTNIDQAVSAAKAAFENWRNSKRSVRMHILRDIGELIRQHREELATLESLSNGKLYREAYNDDLPEAADVFDYYAGWIDKIYGETCPVETGYLNYTLREPVGVCALIVPWNFPLLLACWKLAPALAMGNTIVVKPSEYTPFSLLRFFELIHEKLDVPNGVINLVLGDGEVGQSLVEHPLVNKVSFTGSTIVGKKILRASADSNLKTVTLELGGKSPNIFFEDTPDLQTALKRSFGAMFSHKGEKCSEPTRFFIHETIYDEAIELLAREARRVKCGDPFLDTSDQGPQCNKNQHEKILQYIDCGIKEGARLLEGGKTHPNSDRLGYFVKPTIFADVTPSMRIAQEEIFGPVLSVLRFKDEEEVVQMANQTIYGLAAGLWTTNLSRAHRVASALDAGMIFINQYGCYDFSSPFGGFKQSGWGKEMAIHSLNSYTKVKSVWVKV